MRISWEAQFDSVQDFFRVHAGRSSDNLNGYAVYQMFKAHGGRVHIRCLIAKHHCLGR